MPHTGRVFLPSTAISKPQVRVVLNHGCVGCWWLWRRAVHKRGESAVALRRNTLGLEYCFWRKESIIDFERRTRRHGNSHTKACDGCFGNSRERAFVRRKQRGVPTETQTCEGRRTCRLALAHRSHSAKKETTTTHIGENKIESIPNGGLLLRRKPGKKNHPRRKHIKKSGSYPPFRVWKGLWILPGGFACAGLCNPV